MMLYFLVDNQWIKNLEMLEVCELQGLILWSVVYKKCDYIVIE